MDSNFSKLTPHGPNHAFRKLISTYHPPGLGPSARSDRLPLGELTERLDRFFEEHGIPSSLSCSLRSAALLWHDYLIESHSLSQDIHGSDGSFLHGIMHRREPDYGNAKYWFHRVGQHSAFPEIASRSSTFLKTHGQDPLEVRLVPGGRWDPFAFVDACEEAMNRGNAVQVLALQQIQEIEFDALLASLFRLQEA